MAKTPFKIAIMIAAFATCASVAQAQSPTAPQTLVPGRPVEVEFSFEPFAGTPLAPLAAQAPPQRQLQAYLVPMNALNCPMPVATGDTSNDKTMKSQGLDASGARPMPSLESGCTNPLGPRVALVLRPTGGIIDRP